jgi:RimJ/RimL family protein N-acetyltransferase
MIHYWLFSPIIRWFRQRYWCRQISTVFFSLIDYYAFDTPLSLRHYAIAISH